MGIRTPSETIFSGLPRAMEACKGGEEWSQLDDAKKRRFNKTTSRLFARDLREPDFAAIRRAAAQPENNRVLTRREQVELFFLYRRLGDLD